MIEAILSTPAAIIALVALLCGLVGALLMAPNAGYRVAVAVAFAMLVGVGVAYWFLGVEGKRDDLTPWFIGAAVLLPLLAFLAIAPGRGSRRAAPEAAPTAEPEAPAPDPAPQGKAPAELSEVTAQVLDLMEKADKLQALGMESAAQLVRSEAEALAAKAAR